MKALLAVAIGGAAGAVLRYGVYVGVQHLMPSPFPLATWIVNVVGSLLMGVLVEVLALVWSPGETVRLLLAVGFLGAFTTFSTFALDFAVLYRRGAFLTCASYVILSVVCSIVALFLGMALARRWLV